MTGAIEGRGAVLDASAVLTWMLGTTAVASTRAVAVPTREDRHVAGTDRERWDARYSVAGAGEPVGPGALVGRADLLPPRGRALDVACGRGVVAVWLALRGLTVDAVDVSPVGLAAGAAAARAHGVDVTWIEADLDAGLPVTGPYDVVVCQRFRAPALYPVLAGVLAPGGLLVVTVLSEVGGEGGRFRAPAGELASAFGALDVLVDEEGHGEATLVARRPS